LLVFGVVVVLSGCSSSGDAVGKYPPYAPSDPLTWLYYKNVLSADAPSGDVKSLIVEVTNNHTVALTSAVLASGTHPLVKLTVDNVTASASSLTLANEDGTSNSGGLSQGESGWVNITYNDADLEATIAALVIGQDDDDPPQDITIGADAVIKDSVAATILNNAVTITQVTR
jgi:hypothetical protein